jgi:hypothetical protein
MHISRMKSSCGVRAERATTAWLGVNVLPSAKSVELIQAKTLPLVLRLGCCGAISLIKRVDLNLSSR